LPAGWQWAGADSGVRAVLRNACCGRTVAGHIEFFKPETVRALTSRQRIGMYDQTFRHVIDWGLGFIINSNRYGADTVPYGFGVDAGESTFGHNGFQSSTACADPEHQLVVAVVCNGTPGMRRTIGECAKLTPRFMRMPWPGQTGLKFEI